MVVIIYVAVFLVLIRPLVNDVLDLPFREFIFIGKLDKREIADAIVFSEQFIVVLNDDIIPDTLQVGDVI